MHPRLTAALARQLTRRDAALAQGARPIGWKLGVGDAERIGEGPAVGHLTSATQLIPGSTYEAATRLHADVELAVEIGSDGGISRWAPALELVDLSELEDDAEEIVAAILFHRAFVLGRFGPPADGVVSADLIVELGPLGSVGVRLGDAAAQSAATRNPM